MKMMKRILCCLLVLLLFVYTACPAMAAVPGLDLSSPTGDDAGNQLVIWAVLLAVSAVGIAVIAIVYFLKGTKK